MRLTQENTIAVVIDFQAKLMPFIHEHQELIRRSSNLIEGLALLDIPLITTEQYTKGLGSTVEEIKNALGNHYQPIEKDTFSCVKNAEFLDAIRALGRKNVIVLGIEAHICVQQTVLDLIDLNFNPIVASDCISSRQINDKKFALKRMTKHGAFGGTYESILMELLVGSSHPNFKAISKIIK